MFLFVLLLWSAESVPTISPLASLEHIKFKAKRFIIARIRFSRQYMMSLDFEHKRFIWLIFGVFGTLRPSIWILDVLDVMAFKFWETIFNKILSLRIMFFLCKLGLNLLVLPPRRFSVGNMVVWKVLKDVGALLHYNLKEQES